MKFTNNCYFGDGRISFKKGDLLKWDGHTYLALSNANEGAIVQAVCLSGKNNNTWDLLVNHTLVKYRPGDSVTLTQE